MNPRTIPCRIELDHAEVGILGGTGFVGGHLAAALHARGLRVRILSRHPERHPEAAVLPRTRVVGCRVHDDAELRRGLSGCRAVINLVGILNEAPGSGAFEQVHVELPRRVVEACRALGIPRLLHMSALHADPDGPSRYLQTKGRGERLVLAAESADLHVTVFRPSVIFGPDDHFMNRFAALLGMLPGPFPLARAGARFQPVYVGDVAAAMASTLPGPAAFGQAFDLCGPRVYTLAELVALAGQWSGHPRRVLRLGPRLSRLQALLLEHLPGRPLTRDNLRSMEIDSVCTRNDLEERLGIRPTPLEAIMQPHLAGARERQRYVLLRRLARRPREWWRSIPLRP